MAAGVPPTTRPAGSASPGPPPTPPTPRRTGSSTPPTAARRTPPAPTCSTTATDDRSQLQWARDNLTGTVTTYTYDTAGRLKTAAVSGGKTYTDGYDADGNRTSAGDGTTTQTLTYNPGNQISSTGYTHDSIGNLTKDPGAGTVGYNAAGQMTTVTKTTGTGSYRYAGLGNNELVSQTLPDGSTLGLAYGRDDANGEPLVHEVTVGTTAPAYVDHDPNGVPQVLDTTTSTEIFYILDGTGSPVALVKYDGTVSGSYSYDPYGTYTDTNNSGGTATTTNPYRYKLPGLYDRTTGWIKYGQRWYNPTTGRFTQQDAILHLLDPTQANRYTYAGDDPINNADPTGQFLYGLDTGFPPLSEAFTSAASAVGSALSSHVANQCYVSAAVGASSAAVTGAGAPASGVVGAIGCAGGAISSVV